MMESRITLSVSEATVSISSSITDCRQYVRSSMAESHRRLTGETTAAEVGGSSLGCEERFLERARARAVPPRHISDDDAASAKLPVGVLALGRAENSIGRSWWARHV